MKSLVRQIGVLAEENTSDLPPIDQGRIAPGPKGLDLLRSFLAIRRDRLRFILDIHRRFGDLAAICMGRRQLLIATNADYARHVLVDNTDNYLKGIGLDDARPLLGNGLLTAEGRTWRSHRGAFRPLFDTEQLEKFQSKMAVEVHAEFENWKQAARSNDTFDLESVFSRMVMKILGGTLLGIGLEEISDDLTADLSFLGKWAMLRVVAIAKFPLTVPTPGNLAARRAIKRLDAIASSIATSIRDGSSALGSALFDTTVFDDRATRDEILTFLLAGHETTVITLTWALYLLASHPATFQRMQTEVDDSLGGEMPSFASLGKLRFTKMIVDEVLRLYPPVWMITRKAKADDKLGPYKIPSGAQVLISIYGVHRDERFWKNPEKFDPERFAGVQSEKTSRQAYFPFGLGARSCLGNRFATAEIMTVLAMLSQRFNISDTSAEPAAADAFLTLHPRAPIKIRIHEREFGGRASKMFAAAANGKREIRAEDISGRGIQ